MAPDTGATPPGTQTSRDVLLLTLAIAAGVADAICLMALGVFTAAISANIVFVGIGLGEGDPHTAVRAGLACAGFALGVFAATKTLRRRGEAGPAPRRGPGVLAAVGVVQIAFLVGWLAADGRPGGIALDLLAIASALGMGAQTAVATSWHPGITTTYVSGTLTRVVSRFAGPAEGRAGGPRELLFVAAIIIGAAIGALVLTQARELVAVVPVILTLVVAAGTMRLIRKPAR